MMMTLFSALEPIKNLANNIRKILKQYHDITGQKVSIMKSRIYFPKHCSQQNKKRIMNTLGIGQGNFAFKYLGANISPISNQSQTYKECLNKINDKF